MKEAMPQATCVCETHFGSDLVSGTSMGWGKVTNISLNFKYSQAVVALTFNPSTREAVD